MRPLRGIDVVHRRHFLSHLAGVTALAASANFLTESMAAARGDLRRRNKSAILLWMSGGPATIDIWDLKPGVATGGPFRPISTSGDVQICEHLPMMAKQMHHAAVIRSMSTREADHDRGRYYLHTGFPPNPSVEHPSCGAVVAKELAPGRTPALQIPPFVAIGGGSMGPGFLGMTYAPFVTSPNGDIQNLRPSWGLDPQRSAQRMAMLDLVEKQFVAQGRGPAPRDHQEVLRKTYDLMTTPQLEAFRIDRESPAVRERYGNTGFGNGCLLARRLVEAGVPFVEVDLGGWDTHANNFTSLQNKLPEMDRAMSALFEDLEGRGLLADTAVLWMGEFGRTPRINGAAGRDHWARSWSALLGGAGIRGGIAIGKTNDDGTDLDSDPTRAEDLIATLLKALGIPLDIVYKSLNGRPMKIANGGRPLQGLLV